MFERQEKNSKTMHKELQLLHKVLPQTAYEKKNGQGQSRVNS